MIAQLLYINILFAVFVQVSTSQNETDSGPRTDNDDDEGNENSNTTSPKENQPTCSTSSVSILKKRFVHIWNINNFMQTLEIYGPERFLEMHENVVFSEDTVKGKWSFKLTNTKKYGYVAVSANHSYDDPKTIPDKLIQISLQYSSQKYRGSPFYSFLSLKGTEQTLNQLMGPSNEWENSNSSTNPCYCPPVSYRLPNTKRRNRHQGGEELKYPNNFNTIRQQIPYSLFEFPIFNVFLSANERISNKITESDDLKLKFEIDVMYPEIVKEVSNSCIGMMN